MRRSEEIRAILGISRAEFSRRYDIPIRTLEDWDGGRATAPEWVYKLLERVVNEDKDKEGEDMNELTMDRIRIAKRLLAEKGIKVFQKDIKKVEKHGFPIPSDDGELFDHREIWLVEMKSGKSYEILRETVDENGKFSTGSAKYVVQGIKES